MYLLDTNICVYLMKKKYRSLTEHLLAMNPDEVAVSAITIYELEYGAAKSNWGERTRENLRIFLSPFTILPFDSKDAIVAGQIRAHLASQGKPIGPYDIQIAAQGIARDLTVVTHNIDEFSRVNGLMLEDWVVDN